MNDVQQRNKALPRFPTDRLIHPRAHVGQHMRLLQCTDVKSHQHPDTQINSSTAVSVRLQALSVNSGRQMKPPLPRVRGEGLTPTTSFTVAHYRAGPGAAAAADGLIKPPASIKTVGCWSFWVLAVGSLIFLLPAELRLRGSLEPQADGKPSTPLITTRTEGRTDQLSRVIRVAGPGEVSSE